MVKISESASDGPKLYRLFQDGQLVYTDATHKAWLDEYYNQLMSNPDILIFNTLYASYMNAYHPYEMAQTYGASRASV